MTDIDDAYEALGGEATYGPPTSEETITPDGRGSTRSYTGATFWSELSLGTFEVNGPILDRYLEIGGADSLGFPTSDETEGRDGTGRLSTFENGVIAWSPETGAFEVHGAILAFWQSLDAEAGSLGYPTSAEQADADDVGRSQYFHGSEVYWSDATGAVLGGSPSVPAASGPSSASVSDPLTAFRAEIDVSPWHGLDRHAVADRIDELVVNPDLVSQGNLNLCGPAVFLRSWIARDQVAFTKFAIELYDTGRSSIGSYDVEPDDDACLATDYKELQRVNGTALAPPAEWMVMSALRDVENAVFDYDGTPDEDVSAATTSGEVVDWLEATGSFGTVEDEVNLFFTKGLDHARGLSPSAGRICLVLLNTAMLPNEDGSVDNWVLRQFPNHWVALESPVLEVAGGVQLTYWCYGRTSPYRTVTVTADAFESNYYGAVIAS